MPRHSGDGARVRLGSPDKVLFPETGFTKRDLADYYRRVSPVFLEQLRDRPISRVRYPDGIEGQRIFQRNISRGMPGWIRRFEVSASPGAMGTPQDRARTVTYPVVDDADGLAWMAGQATVEFHTPQWRLGPRGGVRRPDRLVIDLDPGEGTGLEECARVALMIRDRLEHDGLHPRPVTSGGKGLHLYARLTAQAPIPTTARAVHGYARRLAEGLAAEHPGTVIAHASKQDRVGRVFIDWSQNHPAKTTVTPYSLRAKGGSPSAAAPRDWDEIGPGLAQLGPADVLDRLD
ncbi:non-homologous end-joining DNA ligase [Acidipropionibacterium virtanenii]|uniref:Multifunctional non-homologous end joining protein LigD n=1 Tax=Acidipropionibacterium virtanenii TaxID=2057246 RepID=A0A344UUB7_9ACTN|nr:non-homologous end-joining DNA ligase [Acidipropionibacterium virtanenii]AXE38865.1 Multifunctional non-homologous end joining protein LigD [Acidipropionibacterium virtanenii]